MKMIIVLDKICLMGVIAISVYVGYNAGVLACAKDLNKTAKEYSVKEG